MAFTKDLTLASGINLPDGYIKINSLLIKNNSKVDITVDIYKNQSAKNDKKQPVISMSHSCVDKYFDFFSQDILNTEGVNVISQGYEFLKTISFYSDSEDVLDVKE